MFSCVPLFNKHVESLDKRQCNLNHIPEEILRHARSLEELLLDSNHIKEISKHVFRMQKLRRLALSDNEIFKVPAEISNLQSLIELDLSKNDISEIPETIKLCKNLQSFDVSSNPITRLPECLFLLQNLTTLGLSDISITKLPAEIGELKFLENLEARENLLRSLPHSIVNLTKLSRLDLGNNEFETLPPEIGKLGALQELYLDCNGIETLPKEIGELKCLQSLDASENKLLSLPDSIGELFNLNDLTLSQNSVETLPHSVGKLKKLTVLKLDRNRLVTLTSAIGSCSSLNELILTDNLLTELPSSLGNLKKLTVLNVDKNQLTELPATLGSCADLGVLSLRDNLLQSLPFEIGKLERLTVLDVSGNRLHSLPYTLNALTNLQALWLSENQSKPLLKLQTDHDPRTGMKVLTCFLLPQHNAQAEELKVQPVENGFVGGPKVHFPDVDQESAEDEQVGRFERHDTPHPKHGTKLKARQIDGHVIHTEGTKKTDKDASFRVGDGRLKSSGDIVDSQAEPIGEKSVSKTGVVRSPPTPPPRNVLKESTAGGKAPSKTSGRPTAAPPVPPSADSDQTSQEDSPAVAKDTAVTFDVVSESDDKHESRLKRKNTPHPLKMTTLGADSPLIRSKLTEIVASKSVPRPVFCGSPLKSTSVNGGLESAAAANNGAKLFEQLMVSVRRDDEGLGLSISGGLGSTPYVDGDYSIFVSKVIDGGAASKAGLKVRDKLLSVNGVNMLNVDHAHAVEAMRTAGSVVNLTVLRDMTAATTVSGSDVDDGIGGGAEFTDIGWTTKIETISTTIKRESSGLGFNIAGGKGSSLLITSGGNASSCSSGDSGIFISRITPNGPADRDGKLKVGDQILSINGVNMMNARRDQAIYLLTGCSSEVLLVVKREKRQEAVRNAPKSADPLLVHESPFLLASVTPSSSFISPFLTEEVTLVKTAGPLGLSIVGGSDHSSHPFGGLQPGVFISKVIPDGAAGRTHKLRVGDRILTVNGVDLTNATHEEAVDALLNPQKEIVVKVRHDPSPPGLRELTVTKVGDQALGISICGGVGTPCNPADPTDEGIFISAIFDGGAVAKDGRLSIGTRILEVNNRSLLGVTQDEAIDALEHSDAYVHLLVCDGLSADNFAILPLNKSTLSTSELTEHPADDRAMSSAKSELILNSGRDTAPATPPARSAVSLHDLEKWDALNSNEEFAPSPKASDDATSGAVIARGSTMDDRCLLVHEETGLRTSRTDRPAVSKKPTVPLKPSFIKKPLHANAAKVKEELDNMLQSQILSGSRSTVSSPHSSSLSPASDFNPEKLPFAKKLQRFQQVLTPRTAATTHASDESQSPGGFSARNTKRGEAEGTVHNSPVEGTADACHADIASKLPTTIRTRKAENRFRSTFATNSGVGAEGLSPAEQRVLEAEKRAAWRKARLKSLEADAAKAELVMAKVRQLSEHREELEDREDKATEPAQSCSTPRNCSSECELSRDRVSADERPLPPEQFPQKSSLEYTKVVGAAISREVTEHVNPVSGERVVKTVEKRQQITQHEVETTENRLLNIEMPVNRDFRCTATSDPRTVKADSVSTVVTTSGGTSLIPKHGNR